jgi:enoyl-CoA hydratase/carnithine racemase
LLLTGDDRVDAKRAYEIGLINRITEPDQHVKVAGNLARANLNRSMVSSGAQGDQAKEECEEECFPI